MKTIYLSFFLSLVACGKIASLVQNEGGETGKCSEEVRPICIKDGETNFKVLDLKADAKCKYSIPKDKVMVNSSACNIPAGKCSNDPKISRFYDAGTIYLNDVLPPKECRKVEDGKFELHYRCGGSSSTPRNAWSSYPVCDYRIVEHQKKALQLSKNMDRCFVVGELADMKNCTCANPEMKACVRSQYHGGYTWLTLMPEFPSCNYPAVEPDVVKVADSFCTPPTECNAAALATKDATHCIQTNGVFEKKNFWKPFPTCTNYRPATAVNDSWCN